MIRNHTTEDDIFSFTCLFLFSLVYLLDIGKKKPCLTLRLRLLEITGLI